MEYISKFRDVEDQKSSFKCTGVAISQAIEIGLSMRDNTENVPDMSPQFIYYLSKLVDNKPYTKGTPPQVALDQLLKYGICEEKYCPFQANDGDLISTMTKPSKQAYDNAKLYKPYKVHKIDINVDSIKNAVLKYGSVIVSQLTYAGMLNPTGGYIPKPNSRSKLYGSHCLLIVGMSDSHTHNVNGLNCKGFFVELNSYGESTGVNGKQYLAYDCIRDKWSGGEGATCENVMQGCWAIEFSNLKNPNFHLEHQPSEVIPTEPSVDMTFTLGSKEALINGEIITMSQPPLNINGSTMLPMRFIFENLGYAVTYSPQKDGHHSIVAISKYTGNKIQMSIGYTVMYSGSQQYVSAIAPMLYNGTTYVPLRATSELSHCKVTFDNSKKQIHIIRK